MIQLFDKPFWLNRHLQPGKTCVIPLTTDLHPPPLFSRQMKSKHVAMHLQSQFQKMVNAQFQLACIGSVCMCLGNKERLKSGVFSVLPVQKMGPEPK